MNGEQERRLTIGCTGFASLTGEPCVGRNKRMVMAGDPVTNPSNVAPSVFGDVALDNGVTLRPGDGVLSTEALVPSFGPRNRASTDL